jgi:hypothetical protein
VERQGIYFEIESKGMVVKTEECRDVQVGEMDALRQIIARFALGRELRPNELSQINTALNAGDASGLSLQLNYQFETVKLGTAEEHRIESFGKSGEKRASFEPKFGADNVFVITYQSPVQSHS